LKNPSVMPIGLGARDTLRLEAGLCLYGTDIDARTTPVEAALEWSIGKSRRAGGSRAGGFPGAEQILGQIETGASRRRVGLRPQDRTPVRGGAALFRDAAAREPIGAVTSGGFAPNVGTPVAMGYVPIGWAERGTQLQAEVRGRRVPVTVCDLPFVGTKYKR
jgi:aminomethyltransferase